MNFLRILPYIPRYFPILAVEKAVENGDNYDPFHSPFLAFYDIYVNLFSVFKQPIQRAKAVAHLLPPGQ